MKRYIKSYGIALVLVAIYALIKLPVLRLDFTSGFSTIIVFFIIAGVLDMMFDKGERTSKIEKNNFFIAIVLILILLEMLKKVILIRM